jgi:DNA-binding XRE family transcriptional regulator
VVSKADDVEPISVDSGEVVAMWKMVAALIREVREQQGQSQCTMADLCHVQSSKLCRMELGKLEPRIGFTVAVCIKLRIRPSDVIRVAEDEIFKDFEWLPVHQSATPWADDSAELVTRGADVVIQRQRHPSAPMIYVRADSIKVAECPHIRSEVNAELVDGVPTDIRRCVECGDPIDEEDVMFSHAGGAAG